MLSETRFIQSTQGQIGIWDSKGSGVPVVFIHGNSACYQAWEKQFNSDLASKYRFIAINLPGHGILGNGKSDNPKDPLNTYTYQGYASIVHEVMTAMKLNQPICVGWSLGANVVFALTKIRKLSGILITGASPIPMDVQGKMDMMKAFNFNPKMFSYIAKETFEKKEAKEFISIGGFDHKTAPLILKAAMDTDGKARSLIVESRKEGRGCCDCKEVAETYEGPLCIIEGENDSGIKIDYILHEIKYKNLFDKVFVIPNAGHAVFWDQPEEFNKILSLFIEKACSSFGN